jgi:hypothetical protein
MAAPRLRRLLGAAALCLAVGVTGPVPAHAAGAAPCTPAQRQASFAAERARVTWLLAPFTTLRSPADAALLAAAGFGLWGHGFTSFDGAGVAVARNDIVVPGQDVALTGPSAPPAAELITSLVRPLIPKDMPQLLFYRPDPRATDVTNPHVPAFPYTLVGWGYAGSYDLARTPGLGPTCLTRADWYVHERGIHDLPSLGFIPDPPAEAFHGQDPGQAPVSPLLLLLHPGFTHSRAWNAFLWLGPGGALATGLTDPYERISGVDMHEGSWMFQPPPA